MKKNLAGFIAHTEIVALSWLTWQLCPSSAEANPVGGTVTQGKATFSGSGNQLTITTGANTYINWQSFNIGVGQTTTFVEPSVSSVVWNQINSGSPSQILGTLNANGLVVLQNASGFYVGGSASINTAGLVMTTASSPAPNVTGSDAWTFNTPPPTAQIVNYGQINVSGGGSAFLIASDIVNGNTGTISAPGGKIGLYAGEQVLVSLSPDGRGLSSQVTLPVGSVDNEGKLLADAGTIAAQAQTVNQNGLVQANAVQNVNGVVELVAGNNLTLGASSDIEANGDSSAVNTGASPGGFVVLQAGNSFSDSPGSKMNVPGTSGGPNGVVEVFGENVTDATSLQSQINGVSAAQFGAQNSLLLNPSDITLSANSTTTSSASPNFNVADLASYGQVDLHALDNIEISTYWNLPDLGAPGMLTLNAGNNLIVDDGAGIGTGKNWSLNLSAGTGLAAGSAPVPAVNVNGTFQGGQGGIYLNGDANIYTLNGDINLWAANEILINGGDVGGITTFGGGSITATAQTGDVNTGNNVNGYTFGQTAAPYYTVSFSLGGISTAAGGNVTINAGGDVTSFLPIETGNPQDFLNAQYDGGSGAYGPQPGNVTINAGGNVYGHYVVANGAGSITAGENVGAPLSVLANNSSEGFALSLVNGGWSVNAPNGSIYVQDVRNPNGIFGEYSGSSAANYPGYHYFDYSPQAYLSLAAGDSVAFTGYEAPHTPLSNPSLSIPFILPPLVNITTGAGGFILDQSLILFPSADQGLTITTQDGGNFGIPNSEDPYATAPVTLEMSGSTSTHWVDNNSFTTTDPNQPVSSTELADPNPVTLDISGSMNGVNLYATKAAQITVGGDMINSGFVGENLHPSDATSVNVTGKIYDSPIYTFASLTTAIISANTQQPSVWDSVFNLALNPAMLANLATLNANDVGANGLAYFLKENGYLLFPSSTGNSSTYGSNPGFVYDANSLQLGFAGNMANLTPAQVAALEKGSFTVLVADGEGNPIIQPNGQLETKTYNFNAAPAIATLYNESQDSTTTTGLGLQIGGPGQFDIHASSISLGNTAGIGSDGFGRAGLTGSGFNYAPLTSLLPVAAEGGSSVNVTVDGDLSMATSAIYSRDGGDVTVTAGGEIDLSQGSFVFQTPESYGIYTSGHSSVDVTANGNINIGSARIATFDGGDVTIESLNGDVNAGSGANFALYVFGFYINPATGAPAFVEFGDLTDTAALQKNPAPYGSGILSEYPTAEYQAPGGTGQPGNISVTTLNGNIISSLGGISQFALDASIDGPSVNLSAGIPGITSPSNPDAGNILLQGAVVGGQITVQATGKVNGFFVSHQDLNISSLSFAGAVLSGGNVNVQVNQSGGPVVIVGMGKVDATGLGSDAVLLGQNVSVDGGAAQSTLGTSATATAASQNAAGEASSDTRQQVAATDTGTDDDQKKKKKQQLVQRVKRVTVILPKS